MNFIVTGSEIAIEKPFTLSTNSDTSNVTTDFVYPSGTAYKSHVLDGTTGTVNLGSFNGTQWVIPTFLTTDYPSLYVTLEVTDVSAFLASDRTVTATTQLVVGESNSLNNTTTREIEGEFFSCADLICNVPITTVTDSNSTLTSELYIEIYATTQDVTLTLPASPSTGKIYHIKLQDNTFTGIIDGNGNTIDGDATQIMSIEDETMKVVFNGTDWSVYY